MWYDIAILTDLLSIPWLSISRRAWQGGVDNGVSAETGVVVGVEAGVPLRNAESFRLDAGEAGAEPTALVFLNQGLLPPPLLLPLSASVGESKSPGESNTTGTRANCSVGIRI